MWLPPPGPASTSLVTGASSGIGAALAVELARRGQNVTLLARREERLRALAARLQSAYGVRAEVLPCDLTDPVARASVADDLKSLGLRVDVLVSNAGSGTYGRFIQLNPSGEIAQVRLMCEASVELCTAFAPAMARRRSGAILLVASLAAFQPLPNTATYAAAKAFLLSFGEALHAELRSSRVAVTTVCPGPVKTEFFKAGEEHPSQRVFPSLVWQDPERVARASLAALARNRRVAVPGAINRALASSGRLAPHSMLTRLAQRYYRVQRDVACRDVRV